MQPETPRWVYRLENDNRAVVLVRQGIETMQARELTQLEKEDLIHRFETTWERAWKVLKDDLEFTDLVLPTLTPDAIIRAALAPFADRIERVGRFGSRATGAAQSRAATQGRAPLPGRRHWSWGTLARMGNEARPIAISRD